MAKETTEWKVARKVTKEERELVNQISGVFRERIREVLAREKRFDKCFPGLAYPNEWQIEKKVIMLLNNEVGEVIRTLTWNR